MKQIRATLRWHLKWAQRHRKTGNLKARERHLKIVDELSAQLKGS